MPPQSDPATLAEWQREAHAFTLHRRFSTTAGAARRVARTPGGREGATPTHAAAEPARRVDARRCNPRDGVDQRPHDGAAEDLQSVFPAVAGHRLAGGARAGALEAQAMIRAVALP